MATNDDVSYDASLFLVYTLSCFDEILPPRKKSEKEKKGWVRFTKIKINAWSNFAFQLGLKRAKNHEQSIILFLIKVTQALKSKKNNNQKINSEIRFIAENNSVIHSLTYISVKW